MAESDSSIAETSDSDSPAVLFKDWSWNRFEYLARSPKRIRVLHVLKEDSCRKGTLADELNIPRSTLLRTLKEMGEYGWVVEMQNGIYEITPSGEQVVDIVDRFYKQFHSLAGLTQLDQVLPSKLTDCAEFRSLLQECRNSIGVTTHMSAPDAPYEPMQRFAEGLRSAEIECLFLGVTNPFYKNPLQDLLRERAVSEVAISCSVVDTLCQYEQLSSIDGDGSVSVSVTEDSFEFGGYRTSEEFVVEGLDEDHKTQVVVVLPLTSRAVVEWSDYIISDLKAEASGLSIVE